MGYSPVKKILPVGLFFFFGGGHRTADAEPLASKFCLTRTLPIGHIAAMTLEQWIDENKVRMDVFAKQIGVHLVTAYKLRRGLTMPSVHTLAAIERATDGRVTARDFVPQAAE